MLAACLGGHLVEESGLEASCSVIGGRHICCILATSNEDLQMHARTSLPGVFHFTSLS